MEEEMGVQQTSGHGAENQVSGGKYLLCFIKWTKCIKQQGLKTRLFWEQLNWLVFFVIASIHLDAVTQMLHHMLLIFVRNLVIQRLHFYLVGVMI